MISVIPVAFLRLLSVIYIIKHFCEQNKSFFVFITHNCSKIAVAFLEMTINCQMIFEQKVDKMKSKKVRKIADL